MGNGRIQASSSAISPHERTLVLEAFDGNGLTTHGPHVRALEKEMAALLGIEEVVALSSGTAALHMALVALGIGAGDEVLTSTFTCAATANAITYVNAVPVFIDSDLATWNMDPNLLAEALQACAQRKRMPKAVIVVDIYGLCADYGPIQEICTRYGLPIIEDAAEAMGAVYDDKMAGTFGEIGVFSFEGNKDITANNGGLFVSRCKDLAQRVRSLASHSCDHWYKTQYSEVGYSYSMSNLLAAAGRGRLRALEGRVKQQQSQYDFYRQVLSDQPGIHFMPEHPRSRSSCWRTCITINSDVFGATREEVRLAMEAENIEVRPTWKPMHLQPVFSGCRVHGGAVAEQVFQQGLCLPSGPELTEEEQLRVVNVIRSVVGHRPIGAWNRIYRN